MNFSSTVSFNRLFLIVLILWPLLQISILNGFDGAGRIQMILVLLGVAFNYKKILKLPIIIHVVLLWAVYCTINTYIKGFEITHIPFTNWAIRNLYLPYITLCVTFIEYKRNPEKTIKLLMNIWTAFLMIGLMFVENSASYDVGERINNVMGNAFYNTSFGLILFLGLKLAFSKITIKQFYVIFAILFFIIIASGGRKVFGAIIIAFVFIYIGYSAKNKEKVNYWRILLLALIGVPLVNYILDNSSVGERIYAMEETTKFEDNLFLTLMGDRGIQYFEGWELFVDNVWTGIGLMKFTEVNTFFHGLPLHSEYMVQLAECGIVGSLMFLLFYLYLYKACAFLIRNHSNKIVAYTLFGILLAVTFINFSAWTYSTPSYFVYYGIILAQYKLTTSYEKNIILCRKS